MRGHVHHLRLIGVRLQSGVDAGRVTRDSEGRFVQSPTNPPHDVAVVEVKGRIGFTRRDEGPDGETIDTAAHLPRGTVVKAGDELEAWDTGDPNLDGRYEIVGVQSGPALVRVTLRRFTT